MRDQTAAGEHELTPHEETAPENGGAEKGAPEPSPVSPATPEPIRLGSRILFVGNTGTGKSEGLINLFAVHTGQRLFIDVQDHYSFGPAALAESPPPLEVDDPRAIDWQHRTIRYVPRFPGASPRGRREMDELHAAIYNRGDLLVACDEAEDVAPSQGAGAPPFVKKCIKQGRKRKITYGAATQRPAGVDRSVINQAEHGFLFPMVDPDDLQAISYRLGMTARELRRALEQLGSFEYLRHTIGRHDVLHMPALPPATIDYNRRHLVNPYFTRR